MRGPRGPFRRVRLVECLCPKKPWRSWIGLSGPGAQRRIVVRLDNRRFSNVTAGCSAPATELRWHLTAVIEKAGCCLPRKRDTHNANGSDRQRRTPHKSTHCSSCITRQSHIQGTIGGGAGSKKCAIHNAAMKPTRIKPIASYRSKRLVAGLLSRAIICLVREALSLSKPIEARLFVNVNH